MDLKKLQPSIDALNAEIARLTSARDTLQGLIPKAVPNKKPTTSKARSAAQRKRWAEAKRLQREAAKKGTK
jgi:hypothetical protein